MNNIVKLVNIERVQEQACDWVARLDAGNMSDAERDALTEWLNEDPRHGKTLVEMTDLLDGMTILSELSELVLPDTLSVSHHSTSEHSDRWLKFAPAGIAVVVLCVAVMIFPRLHNSIQNTSDELLFANTEVGEYKTITLPDDSEVTLNTYSRINIDFSDTQRNVILTRGEAHFEVEPDPSKPFRVQVGSKVVEAVGTAFNVETNGKEIEITVTEGVVEISSLLSPQFEKTIDAANSFVTTDAVIRVSAGQVAVVTDEVESLEAIDPISIEKKLSWQNGMVVFEGQTLEQVVSEISRYTTTTFVITDDETRRIRVGGYFETGDIDKMLDILEHGFQIAARKSSSGNVYLFRVDATRAH